MKCDLLKEGRIDIGIQAKVHKQGREAGQHPLRTASSQQPRGPHGATHGGLWLRPAAPCRPAAGAVKKPSGYCPSITVGTACAFRLRAG